MSIPPDEGSPLPSGDGGLNFRGLVWFCLPLALTFLMMSGAAPIVSNGITWMHGAEGERIHLSAFLMTFATCLTTYSPTFMARNIAIRTVTDRRSMRRFAQFFGLCSAVCAGLILFISRADVAGHLLFGRILQATPEVEHLARQGMLAFVPIPVFVAARGLGQGCHLGNGQSWYVGVGTTLRLVLMAVFVFGYAIHHDLPGPLLGGLTYLVGIVAETLFVLVTLWNKPQWRRRGTGLMLTQSQFGRYALPLMLGSVFAQLVGPSLIYLIGQGRHPAENGAAFNLIRDTGWVMFSMLMTIQPAVVAYATSARNLRILLRFAGSLVTLIVAIATTVALTPLKNAIFISWLEVDNELIRSVTFTALLFLIPIPIVTIVNFVTAALHTRSGRTAWVTAGNLAGLGLIVLAGLTLDLSARDGAILAVIGNGAFNLTAAIVQTAGLLNGGLTAALTPATLAEHLNNASDETLPDLCGISDPIPERMRA